MAESVWLPLDCLDPHSSLKAHAVSYVYVDIKQVALLQEQQSDGQQLSCTHLWRGNLRTPYSESILGRSTGLDQVSLNLAGIITKR